MRIKIEVLEPICSDSGIFYYAGFVNGKYVHFLGSNRLSVRKIKVELERKYQDSKINAVLGRG